MTGTLAAPLARALEPFDITCTIDGPHESCSTPEYNAGSILAILRSDPEVTATLAEALVLSYVGARRSAFTDRGWENILELNRDQAGRILDALLGKP